jgi:molybdate transport system regulatory protein
MTGKSLKSILNKKVSYTIHGSLWIECNGERFFGPGRVELLQKIGKTGSISKAAKEMGMSYKKAWDMIDTLNRQARVPLVIRQAGGEKGGGSLITEEAIKLIDYHEKLRKRFLAFVNEETRKLNKP